MKLVCISDTHGDHRKQPLPNGDVLIHAGDITGHGTEQETIDFFQWLGSRPFEHKLCIAGNHDSFMEENPAVGAQIAEDNGVTLLNDSGCTINGVSFWGSPITPRFLHWNFMRDPGAPIEAHWNLIPDNTDVLITHGPPIEIMDIVERDDGVRVHTGCPSLLQRINAIKPKYHIFGHIHEGYGRVDIDGVAYCNVSSMDKGYVIANDAHVIELD